MKIASARVSQARIKVNRFDAFARIEVSLFGCIRLLLFLAKVFKATLPLGFNFEELHSMPPLFPSE